MFNFKIEPDEGEAFDLTAAGRDIRMWEKTYKGRSFGMLTDSQNLTFTVLFELAFATAKRRGMIPITLTLDEFADTHEVSLLRSTSDEQEESEMDPTHSAL